MERTKIDTTVFLIIFFGVSVLFFLMFQPFLGAIAVASTFAIIFRPTYQKILKIFNNKKGLASFITTSLIILLVILPLGLLSVGVINEAQNLYLKLTAGNEENNLPFYHLAEDFLYSIESYLPQVQIDLNQLTRESAKWLFDNIGGIFSATLSFALSLFILLFSLFYLFKDGAGVISFIKKLSPLNEAQNEDILNKLEKTVHSVVVGSLLVSLIQGALTGLALFIIGADQVLLWSSLAVILAIIPGVGPTLILIPAGIYLIAGGQLLEGILTIAWGMAIVGSIDNLLRPMLMRRGMPIHPFLILISVLGGISLFGIVGFLIGPVVLSLFLALTVIYGEVAHQQKKY